MSSQCLSHVSLPFKFIQILCGLSLYFKRLFSILVPNRISCPFLLLVLISSFHSSFSSPSVIYFFIFSLSPFFCFELIVISVVAFLNFYHISIISTVSLSNILFTYPSSTSSSVNNMFFLLYCIHLRQYWIFSPINDWVLAWLIS